MKQCSKCKTNKDYSYYNKDRKNKDGYKGICKKCRFEYNKKWKVDNKLKVRVCNLNYRNKKKNGDIITYSFIKELISNQFGMCLYCGCDVTKVFHIEHLTPLSRNGKNVRSNLAISCPTCNLKKSNKLFFEFFIDLCNMDGLINAYQH